MPHAMTYTRVVHMHDVSLPNYLFGVDPRAPVPDRPVLWRLAGVTVRVKVSPLLLVDQISVHLLGKLRHTLRTHAAAGRP